MVRNKNKPKTTAKTTQRIAKLVFVQHETGRPAVPRGPFVLAALAGALPALPQLAVPSALAEAHGHVGHRDLGSQGFQPWGEPQWMDGFFFCLGKVPLEWMMTGG